ncbi:putative membrane protein YdgA-like protein [Legionella birminghamensis]|uniref:Membrane protein YdgA-like protein n=1 Tax=Legionella birminghamensis TaxID=28083 RepID=A0A378I5Q7_9GAMM|nr:YdgA family protein [Legionella birminghamensis]KTC72405.1 putative membrane protein YdgA-like protein [Legionella birminghamensis]STX30537.1 putative membrane protein YdgA-like protein [Legionella birminghamensis]
MKKLLGVVVILAALIIGGYFGMGVMTERTIKKDAAIVNQSNNIFIDIPEYHKGLFKSDAKLNWKFHAPERVETDENGQTVTIPAQDFQGQMPLTVYHGPIIFHKGVRFGLGYAETTIPLPDEAQAQFKQMFTADSTAPQLKLSLFVNYLNNSRVKMEIPSFKMVAQQGGGEFEWLGMSSATTITSNIDKVKGDITIEGMRFAKPDAKVTGSIGEISSEYNLYKADNGLYFGDASISFPSVVVKADTTSLFELDGLDMYSSSDIDGDLFNSHFKVSLNKMLIEGQTYGPGNFELAIRNLDANVLAKLNQQIQQAQQGSEQEKQQALMAMLPDVPKLFARGAEFEISELSFAMPEGTIEGTLLVSLPKGDIGNPFEVMQKIQGNGKLKVPAPILKKLMTQSNKQRLGSQAAQQELVQQIQNAQAQGGNTAAATTASTPDTTQQAAAMTDQQIASMLQSGLIVQQGNDYVVELSLNQGQFIVNTKPFTPAMLKF